MIPLTKLNGGVVWVACPQVESMEQNPDTRLTLVNGKQLYVRETPAEVVAAIDAWYIRLQRGPRLSSDEAEA